mmetsp:Transcript_71069/g.118856  ORF Transcript_71069/g.118856 Transcript_71069/m.118856 type:complete len:248 (-) Transcript_71069:157-900(-)|eukprot:CAMPEP_0174381634 /NCGR_PEP_ID=MMETSP0811_2-20130205/124142_1 /TAXON_ID=73025 ORGANISM="Eutreptiella gymnastica-like, Strain CCMP1594" /NCGR_SAMPLE_ID=MMETSP0811_2 /ASSEMBLY_ACC=CAM_ASM_000667 /LENGTH=247 /DNA_ID=CAMNT_0015534841 /DNA_START=2011 /DNA_END=2754 /DNA_ORIENTATION=+
MATSPLPSWGSQTRGQKNGEKNGGQFGKQGESVARRTTVLSDAPARAIGDCPAHGHCRPHVGRPPWDWIDGGGAGDGAGTAAGAAANATHAQHMLSQGGEGLSVRGSRLTRPPTWVCPINEHQYKYKTLRRPGRSSGTQISESETARGRPVGSQRWGHDGWLSARRRQEVALFREYVQKVGGRVCGRMGRADRRQTTIKNVKREQTHSHRGLSAPTHLQPKPATALAPRTGTRPVAAGVELKHIAKL